MTNRPGLEFSFSGLKTACATAIRALRAADGSIEPQARADVAWAFSRPWSIPW